MSTRLQVDKILDLFPPHLQQGRFHFQLENTFLKFFLDEEEEHPRLSF